MNPWITEQASAARIDDLRRAATSDRLGRDVQRRARRLPGQSAAGRAVGGLLLRAGARLAGADRTRQLVGAGGVDAASVRAVAGACDRS